jgi:hypothetical protein
MTNAIAGQLYMEIDELLRLGPAEQLKWLETRFEEDATAASQDISAYIIGLAWDKPLGSILLLDPSVLEDMLQNPDATDLGWDMQKRLPSISDERAVEINNGEELTELELSVAKTIARNIQINDVYMSESGTFCSGSTIHVKNNQTAFIAFTGDAMGQGGISYSFYRLFSDSNTALDHFMAQPDIWLPLI